MKKTLSILLVFCMVFALLPFAALADGSGSCGEKATWKLSGDTLTISGTGPMQDYERITYDMGKSYADTPWYESREQIKKVVVSDGITRIGNAAFYDVPMDSIYLPDSVTEIGDYALAAALMGSGIADGTLSNLTLPKNLKSIGRYAFSGRGIRALRFPSTVESIGDFAISANGSLEVLSFDEGFETIPPLMIAATYSIIVMDIPASAKRIEFLPERLADVYFHGTEAQWEAVQVPEEIAYRLERAVVHFDDPMAQFSDAPAKANWAYEGIRFCVANDFMNGVGGGLFDPNGTTTRAQLVTILWRMNGSPEPTEELPFDDCGISWADKAIAWAAENEIVNGVGEGKFLPNSPITREQLVTVFYRYCRDYLERDVRYDGNPLEDFPDAGQISEYAVGAMGWGIYVKLISGSATPSGVYLQPQGNATRAQIARIIMNFYVFYANLRWSDE